MSIGTFRSEDEDDDEYEFSVLSTRTSKNVGLQTLCACSVRKTRTRSPSSSSDLKVSNVAVTTKAFFVLGVIAQYRYVLTRETGVEFYPPKRGSGE